jgi:hypothetical protein
VRYFATRARYHPSGYQLVEVLVDRGYQPDVIEAAAGMPIRLVFSRRDDDPCSERVVFSSPRVDRRLAATGTTTVELPGQGPGEVRFTCGMGRYRGRIQVIDSHGLSIGESLRRRLARMEFIRGAALVLAMCTLPIVGLFALGVFAGDGALMVATAVLAAWITGCGWARRHVAHST